MSKQDKNKNLIFINSLCSCIHFSGENCSDFLNNLLISDLTAFDQNKFYYSAICNPKGRIISSLWLNKHPSGAINLICPKNMQETLLTFFNMRKFRLKIDISVINTNIYLSSSEIVQSENELDHESKDVINKFYVRLFNVNFPWINKENTEKFIPQHVNLDQHDNVMSFTKGCYPGQEIIARMKFLGRVKKRMVVIENDNKELLMSKLDSRNQVSPIIQTNNSFSVQIIEKITEAKV